MGVITIFQTHYPGLAIVNGIALEQTDLADNTFPGIHGIEWSLDGVDFKDRVVNVGIPCMFCSLMPSNLMIWICYFFVLPACLFVCLLSSLTFAIEQNLRYKISKLKISRNLRYREFIFDRHTPPMVHFQMTPRSMTF